MVDICWIAIDKLMPNRRNARTHSRKQIRQIADSITAFGFVVSRALPRVTAAIAHAQPTLPVAFGGLSYKPWRSECASH